MRPFFFSPRYAVEIGAHAFAPRKFAECAKLLGGRWVEPGHPSREDLLLAHDPAWIEKVLNSRLSLEEETLLELHLTPEVSLAHQLQVSGTWAAAEEALRSGLGIHVGGGSHHAFADHGEGFCVLNDLAAAARKAGRRVAVVDLDVHQGNGTASILKGRPDAFTFSMHQDGIYPQTPVPGSLDVGLREGTGDAEYLARLEEALPKVFAFKPELVLYQAGVDAFEQDLLGGLRLTREGLARRDRLVFEVCRAKGVPVAVTLGGGYCGDPAKTAELHAQTILTGIEVIS